MHSDAINLPSCLEKRDQNTAGDKAYDGNLFQHRTKKNFQDPPSTFHAGKKKVSNSGLQIQSCGILCYVVVYVGLITDVSKRYISFTYRIKQSLYPDGYRITILRNVWNYLTTHRVISQKILSVNKITETHSRMVYCNRAKY